MARTSAPNSVGSQFFIVLDDEAGEILESAANTYQIIGKVTSGMETVDAIAARRRRPSIADQSIPSIMANVTVANP